MASSPKAALEFTRESWLLGELQNQLDQVTTEDVQEAKDACAKSGYILEVPPTFELVVQLPPTIGADTRLLLVEKYLGLKHKLGVLKKRAESAENAPEFSTNPGSRVRLNTDWDLNALIRLSDLVDLLFEDALETIVFALIPNTDDVVRFGLFKYGVIAFQGKAGAEEELRIRQEIDKYPWQHTTRYIPFF